MAVVTQHRRIDAAGRRPTRARLPALPRRRDAADFDNGACAGGSFDEGVDGTRGSVTKNGLALLSEATTKSTVLIKTGVL